MGQLVILKNMLAYPIAKKDVASWPLVGEICKTTGVIFVNRENKSERVDTINEVHSILEKGFSILNTPEGTTHIEPTTIAFKPGAFVLAAQLGKPVSRSHWRNATEVLEVQLREWIQEGSSFNRLTFGPS